MKKRVKMEAVLQDGNPAIRVGAKRLGTLEYSLQADGTWREFIGEELVVPLLEVSGPDKESIALHLQELRDKLGRRETHNVRLFHCIWLKKNRLRVALGSSSTAYRAECMELADVLIENYVRQEHWFERAVVEAIGDHIGREIDQQIAKEMAVDTEAEE